MEVVIYGVYKHTESRFRYIVLAADYDVSVTLGDPADAIYRLTIPWKRFQDEYMRIQEVTPNAN